MSETDPELAAAWLRALEAEMDRGDELLRSMFGEADRPGSEPLRPAFQFTE